MTAVSAETNFKWLRLGQIIALIHTWKSVFFYNFRNTEASRKFQQRELNTYMICSPVAATVVLFNDMRPAIH